MISANGVSLNFGAQKLFSDVSIVFSPGNCYGLIGANGSGKSTFLRILSGEIDPSKGDVSTPKGKRISSLKQDQFAFDEYTVLMTVLMGHKKLYDIMLKKDAVYAKEDFSDADGVLASELEAQFADLDGWNAESDAAKLLSDLGIAEALHEKQMKQLESGEKVRVLLAQALFGNPDILLLDEPTNHLDVATCMWLEEFLYNFENTAIVVSHDRHFLNKVCTHTADIDFGKIQLYSGNYNFWLESSQIALKLRSDANKKTEEKRKEMQEFISRFSANASKSKQATSRKKALEKLTLEDIKPSSRKYPYINFEQQKPAGNEILNIENLSTQLDGQIMFSGLNIRVEPGDKIAFVGSNNLAKTVLFKILAGEHKSYEGSFKWGGSIIKAYYPQDNTEYFTRNLNIIDWLRQYSPQTDENFVRGFLGRMLFTGDDSLKSVMVLSGGEKVRCMLSRMMLAQGNVLILEEPTNHLDLESITALNRGLEKFPGTILFSSHDHQLIHSVANRIIEIGPKGYIDKMNTTFDEYLSDENIKLRRKQLYA
ncbi:MAG: ATP-binding cassette domain-containing protein [Candidatus Omnitrophica bacterium]|nr:ATP-binding cassette domain-containing protein [Candidatus Omnitrophota bacterium]